MMTFFSVYLIKYILLASKSNIVYVLTAEYLFTGTPNEMYKKILYLVLFLDTAKLFNTYQYLLSQYILK